MEDLPNLIGQSIKNYKILELIDRGGFSMVYIAEDVKTNNRYAMKILYPSEEPEEEEFIREASVYELLSSGRYKHIICLKEAFIHNIITEGGKPVVLNVLVLELVDEIFGILSGLN